MKKPLHLLSIQGPLMEGPVSPVNFKKWQCCMSLLLIYAHVACQFKKMVLSHVVTFFLLSVAWPLPWCRLSNLVKSRVALSNLRVEGHFTFALVPPGAGQEDDGALQTGQGAAVQTAPLRLRAARPQVCARHGRRAQTRVARSQRGEMAPNFSIIVSTEFI